MEWLGSGGLVSFFADIDQLGLRHDVVVLLNCSQKGICVLRMCCLAKLGHV